MFISYNGKISNLYELNIDNSEELEMIDYLMDESEENIKDIEIAQ